MRIDKYDPVNFLRSYISCCKRKKINKNRKLFYFIFGVRNHSWEKPVFYCHSGRVFVIRIAISPPPSIMRALQNRQLANIAIGFFFFLFFFSLFYWDVCLASGVQLPTRKNEHCNVRQIVKKHSKWLKNLFHKRNICLTHTYLSGFNHGIKSMINHG